MTPLTPQNYYDKKTKALTCSKIKDFATDPYYFKRKHILNVVEDMASDAFLIGGIVDKLLSGEDFSSKYEIVARRSASAKAEALERGVTLLLESQYSEIIEIADAVDQTDAWKTIKKNGIFQDILQIPLKINEYFDSMAGKPDVWWMSANGVCTIVDLKTAASADHRKFYYQALGFHYDWQLAMYSFLLKSIHPEIKSFECYNLVVAKDKAMHRVELFKYSDVAIKMALSKVLNTIDILKEEKDYAKYNPSFSSPVSFGDFSDEEAGWYEDRAEDGE